ncbi:MAG TPA: hypothetical protein PLZ55_09115, partial [bacterium]|nr:hypothetical protein [bacterium]
MSSFHRHIAYIRIVDEVGENRQASLPVDRQIRARTLSPKIGGDTEGVEFTGLIKPILSDRVRGSLWGLSQALLARYRAITPLVEQRGTGGAYLDLSGMESVYREPARQRLRRIVESAFQEMNVALSAGLARNKILAYLAACHSMAGQVFELDIERESVFLESLPLQS